MLLFYNNNFNGILVDEMGFGKIIQIISLVIYLIEKKYQNGLYLVIVFLSIFINWNLEFDKWVFFVFKIVYKGFLNIRKLQQEKICCGEFQVLFIIYEYIIKDRLLFSKIKWFYMIIDEGYCMKNLNFKFSVIIQQYYSICFCFILIGIFLQNNLVELWVMFNFVFFNIFKLVKIFDDWFNIFFVNIGGQDKMEFMEEEQIFVICCLYKVLCFFLLCCFKKDVEKDFLDKMEKVIKCKFFVLQVCFYKQMVIYQKIFVSDGKGGKIGVCGFSNMIMQLCKLCNYFFVFDEVENQMNFMSVSNDLLWRMVGKFEFFDRILFKYKVIGYCVLMFF